MILTMSIIMVGQLNHILAKCFFNLSASLSVIVLLLSIELVNIAAASSSKLLLILLLLLLLLPDMSWVAPTEGWVLTVGLGIVAQLGWIISLLVRITVAPVLLLLDTLTLTARVVTLLMLVCVGWVVVRLGGGWVVLQQVSRLSSPKLCQFIPVHLEKKKGFYMKRFLQLVQSQPGLDPLIKSARRRRVQIQILTKKNIAIL